MRPVLLALTLVPALAAGDLMSAPRTRLRIQLGELLERRDAAEARGDRVSLRRIDAEIALVRKGLEGNRRRLKVEGDLVDAPEGTRLSAARAALRARRAARLGRLLRETREEAAREGRPIGSRQDLLLRLHERLDARAEAGDPGEAAALRARAGALEARWARTPEARGAVPVGYRQLWRAAHAGDAAAQADLGSQLDFGMVLPGREHEALGWIRKAAAQGHPDGLMNLGLAYYNGAHGLERDLARAIGYFEQAAARGDEEAAEFAADARAELGG